MQDTGTGTGTGIDVNGTSFVGLFAYVEIKEA
jgi:hypothetical protein